MNQFRLDEWKDSLEEAIDGEVQNRLAEEALEALFGDWDNDDIDAVITKADTKLQSREEVNLAVLYLFESLVRQGRLRLYVQGGMTVTREGEGKPDEEEEKYVEEMPDIPYQSELIEENRALFSCQASAEMRKKFGGFWPVEVQTEGEE